MGLQQGSQQQVVKIGDQYYLQQAPRQQYGGFSWNNPTGFNTINSGGLNAMMMQRDPNYVQKMIDSGQLTPFSQLINGLMGQRQYPERPPVQVKPFEGWNSNGPLGQVNPGGQTVPIPPVPMLRPQGQNPMMPSGTPAAPQGTPQTATQAAPMGASNWNQQVISQLQNTGR
jgi:hypothetical protein